MLVPLEEQIDHEMARLGRPRPSRARKDDRTIVLDEHDADLDLAPNESGVAPRAPAPAFARTAADAGPRPPMPIMLHPRRAQPRAFRTVTTQRRCPPSGASRGVLLFLAFVVGGVAALLVLVGTQAFASEIDHATAAVRALVSRVAHP